MPWSEQQKITSRDKILHSAAQLFVQRGYDAVGINEVMQHANMTRGAFYNHFKSKAELYQHAIYLAGKTAKQQLTQAKEQDFETLKQHYLSNNSQIKTDNNGQICPIALLISDIRNQEPEIRATYNALFSGFVEVLNEHLNNRSEALQQAATLIGAAALAQTITNDELKQELLEACK